MEKRDKGWLLEVGKVTLILAELAFVFASIGVVIGIIALLTFARGKIVADLAAAGAPAGTYLAFIAVLVLIWAIISLSMLFIRNLRAIVDSVDQGDPFHPDNGARLARMGWYALGVQALQFVVEGLGTGYSRYAEAVGGGTIRMAMDNDPSLTGLALAVTLFILAGVFRKGAEMREDLVGTV
jgi:hypothetical protein